MKLHARAAIVAYCKANPAEGPIRIAQALIKQYSFAQRGTVLRVLQENTAF